MTAEGELNMNHVCFSNRTSLKERPQMRAPPSPGEMFLKHTAHKKKSYRVASSSPSPSFILFYVAYQRDLQPFGGGGVL